MSNFRVYQPACGDFNFCPTNNRCQNNNDVQCTVSQHIDTQLDFPPCVKDVFGICDVTYQENDDITLLQNKACRAGAIQSARQPWILPSAAQDKELSTIHAVSRYFPIAYATGLSKWAEYQSVSHALQACDATFAATKENEACKQAAQTAQNMLKRNDALNASSERNHMIAFSLGMSEGGERCTQNRTNQ